MKLVKFPLPQHNKIVRFLTEIMSNDTVDYLICFN